MKREAAEELARRLQADIDARAARGEDPYGVDDEEPASETDTPDTVIVDAQPDIDARIERGEEPQAD